MKWSKLLLGLFALVTLSIGTGCANKPSMDVTQIDPEKTCPEGETCVWEYRSQFRIAGGGIATVVGLTGGTCTSEIQGKQYQHPCGKEVVIAGINPDRLDTLGGAIIGSGTAFGTTAMRVDAEKYKARNSAPGLVLINNNKQSQGQSSQAFAGQTTDVDIGIGESGRPVNDRPVTNYDPR